MGCGGRGGIESEFGRGKAMIRGRRRGSACAGGREAGVSVCGVDASRCLVWFYCIHS